MTEFSAVPAYPPIRPFSIASVGPDLPQGFAVLASASADENAQESDRVGGSIFAHHFIATLRGAANTNADGRVSLTEAFEYSADRTIASSADSLAGVQHASFRYRLRGRADFRCSASLHQAVATMATR